MTSEPPSQTFTPSERISQLSQIDDQIASLLSSAGQALQSLTNPTNSSTLEASKAEFQGHVSQYFTTLSSIDVNLRRQIYALQEAGLIREGTAKDARDWARTVSTGGDMGALDPSWLNSRAKDHVGKGMEEELWRTARNLVERLQGDKESGKNSQTEDDIAMKKEEGMKIWQMVIDRQGRWQKRKAGSRETTSNTRDIDSIASIR